MPRRGRKPVDKGATGSASATPGATGSASATQPAPDNQSNPPGRRFSVISTSTPTRNALFALACALSTALLFSIHPASLTFWDPGRPSYWRNLYIPGERPKQFAKIADLIPPSSRVASTDFVHPRYTHFERSYDYSDYVRQVAGYEDKVPDDTDYIVIDTQHPYSKVRSLEQVRELKTSPDKWEVVPNDTNGYFIILKRR